MSLPLTLPSEADRLAGRTRFDDVLALDLRELHVERAVQLNLVDEREFLVPAQRYLDGDFLGPPLFLEVGVQYGGSPGLGKPARAQVAYQFEGLAFLCHPRTLLA